MNDAKSKHGFERGERVSPRERAWVLRGLGAFLFAVEVVFGARAWFDVMPGHGLLAAAVVCCCGGLVLVIGATFKPLQNVVHRFLEDSVESRWRVHS